MTATVTDTPSDDAVKTLLYVAASGAIGGLLCWLMSAAVPDPTQTHHRFLWPLTCLLGGAAAGAGGIFILADCDRRRLSRCLVFAAFCGLMWRPVTEAVKGSVMASFGSRATRQAVALAKTVAERGQNEVGNQLALTGDETARLVADLQDIEDEATKDEVKGVIETAVKTAITKMEVAAQGSSTKAKESLEALAKVGAAAAESEATSNIAATAVNSLQAVAMRAAADPSVVASAHASFTAVASRAKQREQIPLHIQARKARGETMAAAADEISDEKDRQALKGEFLEAGSDLRSAVKYHQATGEVTEVKEANAQYTRLEGHHLTAEAAP